MSNITTQPHKHQNKLPKSFKPFLEACCEMTDVLDSAWWPSRRRPRQNRPCLVAGWTTDAPPSTMGAYSNSYPKPVDRIPLRERVPKRWEFCCGSTRSSEFDTPGGPETVHRKLRRECGHGPRS